jgi:D-beta-D-heptose 7-phosphate kinase/D-beta-D-heptose 1-phosphate adenosyltransferase
MEKQIKIVVCTGGFDPLHSGHIKYLNAAKQLGDRLIVGVNSDEWLTRKKGRAFMPFEERRMIVGSLKDVDATLSFDDSDGSAIKLLEELKSSYSYADIIFANGGDRNVSNIPETVVKDVTFKFGVGGDNKANSSSWILEEWKSPKTIRDWGYYRVLHQDGPGVKLKELTVDPSKRLSMQRHTERAEFWFVSCGEATVYRINTAKTDPEFVGQYKKHQYLHIPNNEWHQLCNEGHEPLKVIEIQYGSNCIEEDIVRHKV